MVNKNDELISIIKKFSESGWELISVPSKQWLKADDNNEVKTATAELIVALEQADCDCGTCGCDFDPLYKRALILLQN